MHFSSPSLYVLCAKQALFSGLKSLAGLSLAIALSASNTASAQGVTPTPCPPDTFNAMLTGAQEVPPNNSTATGSGTVVLTRDPAGATISVDVTFDGLAANASAAHIHGPAMPGVIAPVIIPLPNFPATTYGTYSNTFPITPEQVEQLDNGLLYINIHNMPFPNGEIRGQLLGCGPTPSPTGTPGATATPTATANPSPSATPTPGGSATPSPTGTPAATPTPAFEGNFVIGDLDAVVGNHVTFWSPCWANVNHLSGGSAPNSFKGFARDPDPEPAECGGTWTTRPGNSSHPPSTVPEQIVAIAASSITKNGPVISGDIPMLVLIETDSDGPNSGGNGGNSRTGTVVAIICGAGPSPTPTATCAPNTFTATLTGDQEVPPNNSMGTGIGTVVLNSDPAGATISVDVTFDGLAANAAAAHIHGPALPGVTAPVIIPFPNFPASTTGTYSNTFPITPDQVSLLLDGLLYINIHNEPFPNGEIRGQLLGCGPTPTPTATPTPPAALANISTRLQVETADNVLIGGVIITGNDPKTVLFRACGGSLPIPDRLTDPILELRDASGHMVASNDNWTDAANVQAIIDTTIPPANNLESAILTTLEPGSYTALVRGSNGGTGIAVVEAYDLDQSSNSCSNLSNISTRGLVQTGDKVLIGGLIVTGQEPLNVMVRAIAPSVPMAGTLADPTLELRASDGTLIASNDNWRSDQEAEINATGIAPTNDLESAVVRELSPGTYTAVVRGVSDTTGIALVEVYGLE